MSEEFIKKIDLLVPANENEEPLAANDNRADKSPNVSEGALIQSAQKDWEEVPPPKRSSQ